MSPTDISVYLQCCETSRYYKSAGLWANSLSQGFDFRDSIAAIATANKLKARLQLVLKSGDEITVVALMGDARDRLAKQAEQYRSGV